MKLAVNNYDQETVSFLEGAQAGEFLQNLGLFITHLLV